MIKITRQQYKMFGFDGIRNISYVLNRIEFISINSKNKGYVYSKELKWIFYSGIIDYIKTYEDVLNAISKEEISSINKRRCTTFINFLVKNEILEVAAYYDTNVMYNMESFGFKYYVEGVYNIKSQTKRNDYYKYIPEENKKVKPYLYKVNYKKIKDIVFETIKGDFVTG